MSEYKNFYDKWKSFLSASSKSKQLNELDNGEAGEIEDWVSRSSPDSYSFNNLFGNKMRILIPMKFEEKNLLPSAKSMLERVKYFVDLSDIWNYDNESLSRGSVYKVTQPKDFGPELNLKRYKRETVPPARRSEQKIVKFLNKFSKSKSLGLRWLDELKQLIPEWEKEADKLIYSQGSIIITRHPMDVARMADIDGIRSCHSPDGMYYKCAVEEAMGNAPVAYYVSKNQLDKLLGDEDIGSLDNQEIIFDKDRGVEGITPTSRLRLRKFTGKNINKEDFELAVPELKVYGNPTAHFRETVTQWALNSQLNQITSEPEIAEKLRNMSWREEYVETRYKARIEAMSSPVSADGSAGDRLEDLIEDMEGDMYSIFPDLVGGDIKWHGGSYKDSYTTDMFVNFFGISKNSDVGAEGPAWALRDKPVRSDITELFPPKFFEYIKEKYHTNSSFYPDSEMTDVEAQIDEYMQDFEDSVLQGGPRDGGSHQTSMRATSDYGRVMDIYRPVKQELENAFDLILQNRAGLGFLSLAFEDQYEDEGQPWGRWLENTRIPVNYYVEARFLLYFPIEYQEFDVFLRYPFTPDLIAAEIKSAVQETVGGKVAEVWKDVWWEELMGRSHNMHAVERAGNSIAPPFWEVELKTNLGDEKELEGDDVPPIDERKKQIMNDIKSFKVIISKKAEIEENIKNRISILYQNYREDAAKEGEVNADTLSEAKRGRKKSIKRKSAKRRTASRNKRAKKKSEKKDACYHKVRARYDVWPSAYASGALVKCRKMGAKNWGNSSEKKKSNESLAFKRNLENMIVEILAEGKVSDLIDSLKNNNPDLVSKIDHLVKGDPTGRQKHLAWSVFQLKLEEDPKEIIDAITRFEKLLKNNRIPTGRKNLSKNNFPTLNSLVTLVTDLQNTKSESQKRKEEKKQAFAEADFLNLTGPLGDRFTVVIPKTTNASCYFGRGTAWCTSAKNNNQFNRYTLKLNLTIYYVIDRERTGGKNGDPFSKVAFSMYPDGNKKIVINDARDKFINIHQLPKDFQTILEEYIKPDHSKMRQSAAREYRDEGRTKTLSALGLSHSSDAAEKRDALLKLKNNFTLSQIRDLDLGGINLKGVNLSGVDLRGIDFSEIDLKGIDFGGVKLKGVNFHGVDLEGAIFSHADLEGVDFDGANLEAANFKEVDLKGINLSRINFRGANFSGANLEGANFEGANFRVINLKGANLHRANISVTDLSGADLRGADLRSVSAERASFFEANLEGVNLSGADLAGAGFSGANLEGANLEGVDLEDSWMKWTNLKGANLNGANLEGVDFKKAKLEGANLKGVKYNARTRWPLMFSKSSIEEISHNGEVSERLALDKTLLNEDTLESMIIDVLKREILEEKKKKLKKKGEN